MSKESSTDKQDKDQSIPTAPNHGVVGVYRSTSQIFWANLMGGMAWGLGTVLGATIIVAIIIILLNALGGVPFIGDFLHRLAESITNGPATPTQ